MTTSKNEGLDAPGLHPPVIKRTSHGHRRLPSASKLPTIPLMLENKASTESSIYSFSESDKIVSIKKLTKKIEKGEITPPLKFSETDGTKTIAGGTIAGLIDALDATNSFFTTTFLTTYRSIMSPIVLYDNLIMRYEKCNDKYYMPLIRWVNDTLDEHYTYRTDLRIVNGDGSLLCKMLAAVFNLNIPFLKGYSNRKQNIQKFILGFNSKRSDPVEDGSTEKLFDIYDNEIIFLMLIEISNVYSKDVNDGVDVLEKYRGEEKKILEVFHILASRYAYDLRDADGKTVLTKMFDFAMAEKSRLDETLAKSNEENMDSAEKKNLQLRIDTFESLSTTLKEFEYKNHLDNRKGRFDGFAQKNVQDMHIENYSSNFIASQLTCMDSDMLEGLRLFELLNVKWTKKEKKEKAPTVIKMISYFNHLAQFVATHVLMFPGTKYRAEWISNFIEIVDILVSEYNNYSSSKAILSGLQTTAIYRLKKTWALVSKDTMELYSKYSNLFAEAGCSAKLRKETNSKLGSLCIPYLGMYLTDLTMLDCASEKKIAPNIYNFEKNHKDYQTIQIISIFQTRCRYKGYSLSPDATFQWWFNNFPIWDDEKCYRESLKFEPTAKMLAKISERRVFSASKAKKIVDKDDVDKKLLACVKVITETSEDSFYISCKNTAYDLLESALEHQYIPANSRSVVCLVTKLKEVPIQDETKLLVLGHNKAILCVSPLSFSIRPRFGLALVQSNLTTQKSFFIDETTVIEDINSYMVAKVKRKTNDFKPRKHQLFFIKNKEVLQPLDGSCHLCTLLSGRVLYLFYGSEGETPDWTTLPAKAFTEKKPLKRKVCNGHIKNESIHELGKFIQYSSEQQEKGQRNKTLFKDLLLCPPPAYQEAIHFPSIPAFLSDPPPFE